MTVVPQGGGAVAGGGGGTANLYDILDLILDRGLVIDVFVRVSLVGIEILKIDARVVVASVDTYLRFAEAAGRLNIAETGAESMPELLKTGKARLYKAGTEGAIEGVKEELGFGNSDRGRPDA
jgi:gas vesicle structural protein